ncbi:MULTISPECIES: DUF4625 domain-containing protein [unclassified Carboxylicivirga]|uniref:DUF4625 domain-containing protein n=1 Tax=Carboxylicivirga TaxID=1628153 RepID=UPI003D34CF8F
MKKYISKIGVLLVVLSGLLVVSCSDDDDPADTNAPQASFTAPAEAAVYQRGQSLICDAVFEDDRELAQLHVSIANVSGLKGWDTPWTDEEVIPLVGKRMEMSGQQLFGEAIPMEIMSGEYEVTFTVEDKTGNKSEGFVFAIVIN